MRHALAPSTIFHRAPPSHHISGRPRTSLKQQLEHLDRSPLIDRPTSRASEGSIEVEGRKEGKGEEGIDRRDGWRRGGRRDGGDEAGGGDGGGAVRVRGREHLLQAGGVRRHGHAGPHRLPLPLRLRRPRAARLLRREEEADEADVASHPALLHLRPLRGLAGAEPLHLRHEAHLRHIRLRHDQPHPGHHLRPRRALPLRAPRYPHSAGPGQGRRHAARRRGRHAAHLLQGRAGRPLAPHPRQPRRPARRTPPRNNHLLRAAVIVVQHRGRGRQPRDGLAALHGQLLLLRPLAHSTGQAQPGVPVPLLHHGAHVRHERAPVRALRALLRPRRPAVEARRRYTPPRRRLHRRARVRGHARRAIMVRQAPRPAVRFRVQPHDARRRRRPQLPPARGGAAPRQRARGRAHRPRPLRRAMGERARGRRCRRRPRKGCRCRRGGPAYRHHRASPSASTAGFSAAARTVPCSEVTVQQGLEGRTSDRRDELVPTCFNWVVRT